MRHSRRRVATLIVIAALSAITAACSMNRVGQPAPGPAASPAEAPKPAASPAPVAAQEPNVYGAAMTDKVDPRLEGVTPRVYVPNAGSGTVDVIDPTTFEIIDHFKVGKIPHHITPSWDLQHLYVNNTESNTLTEIDPKSGKPTRTIPVEDPYNLYYTADGSKAIVVAERFLRLDFRDPKTWELIRSVPIPWPGVDHLDFSADGRFLVASTEYAGYVAKVDVVEMELTGQTKVGGLPIDVRLSPDGSVFYVANQGKHGVHVLDANTLKEIDFLPTGRGAHGFHVSRDTKSMYVSNRLAGTISVIDTATRRIRATWRTGGSPDMMQVSPDGTQLWVSDRFSGTVTVVNTATGEVIKKIKVGNNPHGLTYFPNPGRFSLGHNGVYR
jgi:YVTN family beta-propeller protein